GATVAAMGEHRLRGGQDEHRQQARADECWLHCGKGYGVSGTFSGHGATTTAMTITLFKHALVTTTATAALVLLAGGIASAHLDPDPIAMQAGTAGTVQFKVEHGCNGSPTKSMKFQIPTGVTGVTAGDKAGWGAEVTGGTVAITGRP